ncbi:MAG: CDP-alcohol phosphatidyltransferase family protein [Firmicutes bacterium]|nr:CDP-alcohol phosphatidyltransferase family protein [Bacillota bacterium]
MNIPNALTLLRILVIPPFLYFYLFFPTHGEKIALIFFLFSGITDLMDGFIARKLDQVTKIGTILDPLADKMVLISVLTVFVIKNKIEAWILLVMFLKELLMILGAFYLYNGKKEIIPANVLGKVSTALFYAAGFSVIINLPVGYSMIVLFLVFNFVSTFFYFLKFITIRKEFNR